MPLPTLTAYAVGVGCVRSAFGVVWEYGQNTLPRKEGNLMKVTKKIADAVAVYRVNKAEIDRLTKENEAHRAAILDAVPSGAVEYAGQAIASVNISTRNGVDWEAVRKAFPAVDEAIKNGDFAKPTTVTTLRTV